MSWWIAGALGALLLAAMAAAEEGRPPAQATAKELAWMCGTWSCPKQGGEFQEHWMAPAGDSLVGVGRLVVEGRTRFMEFLSVEPAGEGMTMWILLGAPSRGAKQPKPFRLVRLGEGEALFEMAGNDFPRTILYRRQGEDGLLARLEGVQNGRLARDDYEFGRVR